MLCGVVTDLLRASMNAPLPEPDPNEIISVRVNFYGHVQGVGFRYQTCRIADHYDVCGTVKNLSDGSVELIAQGKPETVSSFIQSVHQGLKSNISRSEEKALSPQPGLQGFRVAY